MTDGKKFSESAQIGAAGIALMHTIVNRMGHSWRPGDGSTDVGIDGVIELRNPSTGVMSGQHIYVQSKARRAWFAGEDDNGFHFLCEQRDLDYWLRHPEPVILVCSHPDLDMACWVHLQGSFADPARKGPRRVDFDNTADVFSPEVAGTLLTVSDPHGGAHTPVPVAKAES